LEFPLSTFLFP